VSCENLRGTTKNKNRPHQLTIKFTSFLPINFLPLLAPPYVGTHQIAKNIKVAANKMVTAGTVTTGVSKKRAKVGQLVSVNILKLDSAQRAEDLKGFRKMYGINYSRNIYKVASIIPRTKAAGADEYLLAEAYKFVPENRKTGTKGYYLDLAKNRTTALLPRNLA